ncbi:MAG: type II toxin-antitoxin system Phd/YefM family antitoxin [Anaerolineae bacterium]
MSTQTVTVAQARSDFSNLLAQAELLNRRFVIARRGKPKAALISIKDLARLEALERTNTAPRLADRERAIQALQQAGLIRPVSGELVDRYAHLEADEREAIRTQLAERRFDPPLSEQISAERGED